MTVRISKPSIDLRSKLSELERPIGVKGNELMRAETAQDARELVSVGRKNLIINGDMRVAQRSTTFSGTANSIYSLDMWHSHAYSLGNGRYTVDKDSDAPDGFHYSIKYACSTADTSTDANAQLFINQKIEADNINYLNFYQSNSDTVTISFYVKSNKSGSYSASLKLSNNNSGHTNGSTRNYNFTYTIHHPGVWERKTKTITLDQSTSYSKSNPNAFGMAVDFWLLAGTSRDSATANSWVNNANSATASDNLRLLESTSNYLKLTGVQVEVGKNVTEFEHRPYGEELALCQRYFYINGGEEHDIISQAFSPHTTEIAIAWPHPTEMRATPTVTISSTNNNNTDFYFRTWNNTGFALTGNGRSLTQMTKHHASIWFNGMSSVPAAPGQVRVQNDRTAFIYLSAEF